MVYALMVMLCNHVLLFTPNETSGCICKSDLFYLYHRFAYRRRNMKILGPSSTVKHMMIVFSKVCMVW